MKGFSELSPVLIEWEDISACDSTWPSAGEIEEWLTDVADARVEQVGYIVFEDDHLLVIADSYIEAMELYGNVTKIPKSNIRRRIDLIEK